MHRFTSKPFQSSTEKQLLVILLFFVGINSFLYQKLGVKIANDSFRYLEYSAQIINEGNFYKKHDFWYIGYALFVSGCKLISDDNRLIVFLQLLANGISILALYGAAKLLFQDLFTAFLAAFSYLLFIEISYWNFYILTESFYASTICFSIFCLIKSSQTTNRLYFIFSLLVFTLTFFTKPTGLAILFSLVVYVTVKMRAKILQTQKWKLAFFISIVLFFSYLLINKMLETFTLIENYMVGEIVFGITSLPGYPSLETLTVDTSGYHFYVPPTEYSPIFRTLLFLLGNPLFTIKLIFLKLFWYIAHIKPYYSWTHNFFILASLIYMYFFSFIYFRKKSMPLEYKAFFGCIIIINCLIVAFTSEDWDGRFIIPILPVVFLTAAPGIRHSICRLQKTNP